MIGSTQTRHPSALALHEYHLEVLSPQDADGVRAHLASCERCRRELDVLAGDHRRFERELLPQTRDAVVERAAARRRPWRWALPSIGLVAAGAAAWALFVIPARRVDSIPADQVIGVKGEAPLSAFALRDGQVIPVEDGRTVLRPGDRIRFVLRPGGLRFAIIAAVDGSGRATVYHPFGGNQSAPIEAAARLELPGSIALDDSPGAERVFAVLSAQPLSVKAVLESLEKLGAGGAGSIRAAARLPLAAEAQASVLFDKARP